jgi:acetyl esterase/lipase
VERVSAVPYYDGPEADGFRHRLDLFLPKGCSDFPVVVLVHGGFWMMGDNCCCGLYSSVGEFLARQRIGVAMPNHRLAPGVKHPEHVKDIARAVAWTRAHIGEHGGDPRQLFLAGHSSGGHLVALLATDETYLRAEGLSTADVRGVMTVSSPYRIPAGNLGVTFGGATAAAFRFEEFFPLRRPTGGWAPLASVPGIPLSLNVFGPAFGDDPQVRANASPLHHVRPGLPPFLICYAEKDFPSLAGVAEEFHAALLGHGNEAHLLRVQNRNHNSIMFRAMEERDPVARAMVEFVWRHAGR